MIRLLAFSQGEKDIIQGLQRALLDFDTMLAFINSKRDVSIAPQGVRTMVGYLRTIAQRADELADALDADLQVVDPIDTSDPFGDNPKDKSVE